MSKDDSQGKGEDAVERIRKMLPEIDESDIPAEMLRDMLQQTLPAELLPANLDDYRELVDLPPQEVARTLVERHRASKKSKRRWWRWFTG